MTLVSRVTKETTCVEESIAGSGTRAEPLEAAALFFRPTPYGFRQVVQHVSNHVACEIN